MAAAPEKTDLIGCGLEGKRAFKGLLMGLPLRQGTEFCRYGGWQNICPGATMHMTHVSISWKVLVTSVCQSVLNYEEGREEEEISMFLSTFQIY